VRVKGRDMVGQGSPRQSAEVLFALGKKKRLEREYAQANSPPEKQWTPTPSTQDSCLHSSSLGLCFPIYSIGV
jgi:hypothetical protein